MPRRSTEPTRTHMMFYPPADLAEQIRDAADNENVAISAWVIQACRERLERERDERKNP